MTGIDTGNRTFNTENSSLSRLVLLIVRTRHSDQCRTKRQQGHRGCAPHLDHTSESPLPTTYDIRGGTSSSNLHT